MIPEISTQENNGITRIYDQGGSEYYTTTEQWDEFQNNAGEYDVDNSDENVADREYTRFWNDLEAKTTASDAEDFE